MLEKPAGKNQTASESDDWAPALSRESQLFFDGITSVRAAVHDAVYQRLEHTGLAAGASFASGFALSGLAKNLERKSIWARSGIAGLAVATTLDVWKNAKQFAHPFVDAWQSGAHFQEDRKEVRRTAAPFLVDLALGTLSARAGARFGNRYFHPGDLFHGIPQLRQDGYLPEGVFRASWADFSQTYGTNAYRQNLLNGMQHALTRLKEQGISEVHVGGSFITSKKMPGDFDLSVTADSSKWEQVSALKEFSDRNLQKQLFGGEIVPNDNSFLGNHSVKYFRKNGRYFPAKRIGVIQLDLGSLPSNTQAPLFDPLLVEKNKSLSVTRPLLSVTRPLLSP